MTTRADAEARARKEAAEALAQLAVACRRAPLDATEKRALAGADVLTGLGNYLHANPDLRRTLLGGAIGAGLGGAGALAGNAGEEPHRRRSVLGSMLTGGLAGAGVGYGASRLMGPAPRQAPPGLSHLRDRFGGLLGGGAGAAAAGAGAAAAKGGVRFGDPDTGQPLYLDPRALEKHPELAGQVAALKEPSWHETAMAGITRPFQWLGSHLPLTPYVWGGMAAGDAALNSNTLRTGDYSVRVPGTGGRRFRFPGMVSPENSTIDRHLIEGINAEVRKPELFPYGPGEVETGKLDPFQAGNRIKHETLHHMASNNLEDAVRRINATPEGADYRDLTAGDNRALRRSGAQAHAATHGEGYWTGKPAPGPRIQRGVRAALTGSRAMREQPYAMTSPKRLGNRLAAYGAVPLAEIAGRSLLDHSARRQGLREVLERLRAEQLVHDGNQPGG